MALFLFLIAVVIHILPIISAIFAVIWAADWIGLKEEEKRGDEGAGAALWAAAFIVSTVILLVFRHYTGL